METAHQLMMLEAECSRNERRIRLQSYFNEYRRRSTTMWVSLSEFISQSFEKEKSFVEQYSRAVCIYFYFSSFLISVNFEGT